METINGYQVLRIEWHRGRSGERNWIGRCLVDRGPKSPDRYVVWNIAADTLDNNPDISAFDGAYTRNFPTAANDYESRSRWL